MINIGFDTNTANEDFILDIRDKNQVIKVRYAINSNDIEKNVLMSEHYIEISFEYDSFIPFLRTDYIEWEGEKYIIKEDYIPNQENKFRYKYTLRFDHWTTLLQDDTFYYTSQGLEAAEWSLTSNAANHFRLIADNANRYFGVNTFNVGTIEFDEIKFLTFSKISIWDAATQIANAYNGEWHLTGTTFHLVKKFSYGSEIDFETEVSVANMGRSEGENSEKYSRILALGSTRNIPANYRETTPGEAVDAIYQKRLRIPASKGNFIDIATGLSPEQIKSAVVIFEEVYPKRIGTISSVSTVEYTDTDTDTGVVTTWNAYRYKDTGLQFKNEYLLPGIELRLVFQSGNLNGMDFALKFNPLGKAQTDPESQIFEIVRNEDYGKALPNDTLKPQNGDTYILYGFNIALVSDQYVPAGEQELFEEGEKWLIENNRDKSVFECPTMLQHFVDNEMDLAIGQKVKLINDQFEGGSRSSRIQGYEKSLLNKYQATYTVGDNAVYSRLSNIEESIKELQIAGNTYQATGNNGVYLIKQFDNTPASDFNAYSAKASDARYLNRISGGTVQGDTTFQKKVKAREFISDQFGNETFTSGQFGSGFKIWKDANTGISYAEFDNLLIRREMTVNVLTIAEIKSVGGQILLSLANMYCNGVTDGGTYWKCTFNTDNGTIPNQFAVDDQVICRKFNSQSIKYYWAKVVAVGDDYINISKSDKDGSGVPAIGDEIIQFGNRTNTARQAAIILSAYGSDAPSIKQYAGINSYDLTGKEKTVISPSGNKFTGTFIIEATGKDVATLFQQLSGQIALKVNQSDFNALGSRVSAAEASITINANNITSVVEKVDNIQIGGVNLLDDSSFEGGTGNSIPVNSSTISRVSGGFNGSYCMKTVSVSSSSSGYCWQNMPTVAGQNYVASCYVRADSTIDACILGVLTNSWSTIKNKAVKIDTTWQRVELAFTATDTNTRLCLFKANVTFFVDCVQLEEGNKATAWSESPSDIQNRINTAQSTADRKNQTFYQDVQPTAPSGGFKVGDLWYKTSLVDFDGNINTDTTKNIYQLQYRWNGTTWQQINWSASRSKILQTDSSISQLVEKTGINSLGTGETLKSLIDQTPSKIELAVSSITISGRNYFRKAQVIDQLSGTINIRDRDNNGFTIVVGTSVTVTGGIARIRNVITSNGWWTFSGYVKSNGITGSFKPDICDKQVDNSISYNSTDWTKFECKAYIDNFSTVYNFIDLNFENKWYLLYFKDVKVEPGNKSTTWTPAIEDTQSQIDGKTTLNEVASSLTITDNKISLASKTIELNGTTIAKAIQAESLDVGNGNFHVGTDGKISAKGATISGLYRTADSGQRIEIDPINRSISLIDDSGTVKSIWYFDPNLRTAIEFPNFNSSGVKVSYVSIGNNGVNLAGVPLTVQGSTIHFVGLPTTKPSGTNQLWRDGDVLKVT